MNRIKFILDGCDISFVAEAPEDITLKQLLKQCDRIYPSWCACGIKSIEKDNENLKEEYQNFNPEVDIIIDYDNIRKANEDVSCSIK